MKRTYSVDGMTCQGCVSSVKEKLLHVDGIEAVEVDLDKGEAEITMQRPLGLSDLRAALPDKYSLGEMGIREAYEQNSVVEKSKFQQLKPLLLIFGYLFAAAFLLHYEDWNTGEAMLDFMGLFYIVFSFFKFLDLKGFPESFRMYDPLARAIPIYGWIYPFLELLLGLMLLMRFEVQIALMATILILGITTYGVTKTLLDKKAICCACLGTALQLPMTEATFIENAIMLLMAIGMLAQMV
ncbi:cation transporter [Muricauda sp. SCSIO 64092]|uniref:heavy-metal-associated domain-containing protein n=1 Tax=Allomuricauda sp. SCSIO 64092 TaxID=2908842 RepID=UPI001FF17DBD|nr:heavy metal-associated domain-containing protein [Muricauda sp. SCSIO 64092]UOY08164.1 cation transporter [Muricauda sp. SCSIO 64092]